MTNQQAAKIALTCILAQMRLNRRQHGQTKNEQERERLQTEYRQMSVASGVIETIK